MSRILHNALFSIAIISMILIFGACKKCNNRLGELTEETHRLSAFKKLHITGKFGVQLCQDSSYSLSINGLEGFMENIHYQVNDSTLTIENQNRCALKSNYSDNVVIKIGCAVLEDISMSNPNQLITCGPLQSPNLKLYLDNCAPEVFIQGEFGVLNIDVNGGSPTVELNGTADYLKFSNSSFGQFNAEKLLATESLVSSNSTSRYTLWVQDKLTLWLQGSEYIRYKGDPEVGIDKPDHSKAVVEKL